jgi:paraquat-inducible protein A
MPKQTPEKKLLRHKALHAISHPESLARRHGRSAVFALGILSLAEITLIAGLILPFVRVDRFFIFTDTFSLLEAIGRLFSEGEFLIGFIVAAFSMVFPMLKNILTLLLWYRLRTDHPTFRKTLSRLEWLAPWSMLDVFIAALLIVSVKATGLADATAEPGLYLFVVSAILNLLATQHLSHIRKTLPETTIIRN